MHRRVGSLVVLLVVVLASAPAGAPIQLSFVYSDSMEPTIGVNDGYILVPAGEIQPGDIVTFWSPNHDAHVTHRVVGRTNGGYLTKGDNNPTTDQAANHPPVDREQIRGAVLMSGGTPVLIPHLGSLISIVRTNIVGLVAALTSVLAVLWFRDGSPRPHRDVLRIHDIARPVFVVGFFATVGFLTFGGASHDVSLVAVESAAIATNPSTMLVGTTEPIQAVISLPARPFTIRLVGAEGVDLNSISRNSTYVSLDGVVRPPERTGPVPARITLNQYPAVLPGPILEWLHERHPLAAATATAGSIFTPLWLVFAATVDGATPIRRSRSRLSTILMEGFK